MTQITALFFALLSTATLCAQTTLFKGAWFDVKYPSSFTARPSLPAGEPAENCLSAFFESPDHTVVFYVFSPQWSGEPTDIAITATETLSDTRTSISQTRASTWWTITGKGGAYTRSYHEQKDTEYNTCHVFGIRYTSMEAYTRYKKEYAAFKASLVQYAD